MKITNKKKITNFLSFNFKLIALSSLIFSQLSLSEIFLYQNNPDTLSTNIAQADVSDAWYDPDWNYRKQITINSAEVPNSNQTNFPVLVSVTDAALKIIALGGKVGNANGYDIIFTNKTGDTQLAHEVESYDETTGTIVMWVKIPILSHATDTVIYIYYGNSDITTTQEHINSVWNDGGTDNFKGVWHMNGTATGNAGDYIDSTVNANNSTDTSDQPVSTASGQIGGAQSFNGTSTDQMSMGSGSSLDMDVNNFTVEAWVNAVDAYGMNQFVGKMNAQTADKSGFILEGIYNGVLFTVRQPDGAGSNTAEAYDIGIVSGTWNHIVGVRNATNIIVYVNGVQRGSAASTGLDISNSQPLRIGGGCGDEGNGYPRLNGTIDEVRISNTARSADWIATEYNNQSDPSSFLTLSSSQEEYMDHLAITAGATTQIAGATQTLTLTAINIEGDTNTLYTGDRTIALSGATTIDGHTPTFTDKNAAEVNFDSSGTILFTNGVATTDIKLYKAESAEIDVTDETYSTTGNATYDLNVTVSPLAVNSLDISSPATITSETPFPLSLTAKDTYGNVTTDVTNFTTLSLTQGTINISSIPNTGFTTNGIYTNNITISNITQNNNIILTVANGSISDTQGLSVIGVSHSVGLFPPKPVIDPTAVAIGNLSDLPDNITQIAISRTSDFSNVSWQDFDKDKFNHLNENQETLYFKFRTSQGAVSDIVVYTPQAKNQTIASTLNEGDIVKTISSPDVYVIKIKNNKKFKRLILSPKVFQSYGHLKWENLKTISQEELNQYTISDLVKETQDTIIYELFPNGDTGERKVWDITNPYDIDSIYEINATDRDSYILVK